LIPGTSGALAVQTLNHPSLRIWMQIAPTPNFVNEFDIFDAIKNDSIDSAAEGSARGDAIEVPFGREICGPGGEASAA
jgi:hypothetical protein